MRTDVLARVLIAAARAFNVRTLRACGAHQGVYVWYFCTCGCKNTTHRQRNGLRSRQNERKVAYRVQGSEEGDKLGGGGAERQASCLSTIGCSKGKLCCTRLPLMRQRAASLPRGHLRVERQLACLSGPYTGV